MYRLNYGKELATDQMASPPSRIVETAYGKVQGRRLINEGERQVDAFQGIPFAAPPIGELRFKKPQPPTSWNGVKETKSFSARSVQKSLFPGSDDETKGITSEDCLYLNVFTPCWGGPEGGFPVMVFIHGGAFIFGEASSYGDKGICENIVTRGIVFVTIQYRLGYLGFFSTGDSACPGNLALWDQVAALKWVQQNIGAFGGNQNNVTLLGQSAGSACVDLLHLSPHSTGLFHKAICMAGTAECRSAIHPDMPHQSRGFASRIGIGEYSSSGELLDKLRELPAESFTFPMLGQVKEDNADFETCPCLDGDFFPSSLATLREKATPKPFLTGVTKEEGLFLLLGRKSTPEGLEEALNDVTRDCMRREEMKAELRARYIGNAKPEDPAYIRGIARMTSDGIFAGGTLELCRKTIALQNEPVYLYVFEHHNPSILGVVRDMVPIQDATHTGELFYLFKKGFFADPELTETEMKVMDTFTTACTNFAKYGNPNGVDSDHSDLPTRWDAITKENPGRNYVITTGKPWMREEFFEGRPADFINIRNKHK